MAILQPIPQTIAEAARHLRAGGLVAMPTETVYGLAGDATSDRAVALIFELKARPRFNPLICHVSSIKMAETIAVMDRRAKYLAQRQWPGPLTLVLPRRADAKLSRLATAGLDTVAVRMPDHGVALDLIEQAGVPIAAPSANRSGGVSPTTPSHVEAEFGKRLGIVLDGGPARVGLESTVLDLTGPVGVILRPGAVQPETIQASIGELGAAPTEGQPKSPGMLSSHYAPRRPLRLDPDEARKGEALLAFGPAPGVEGYAAVLNLSAGSDLAEAAANLFAYLRMLDEMPGVTGIAAMTVPERGLGVAINDRLRRAAAPRPDPAAG